MIKSICKYYARAGSGEGQAVQYFPHSSREILLIKCFLPYRGLISMGYSLNDEVVSLLKPVGKMFSL